MMRWLRAVGNWFDARLKVRETLLPMMEHPIPREAAGPMGWWYVFGSASLTLLIVQILTGIGLALVYVPSADKAYDSLLYLNYDQSLGWFLRALHYYAGSGMVVLVLAHMTQVFLHGAYKYPRELTWVLGVLLLLCTLGMFFTGQVLRWDPDAYWGLAVGGSMAGRVPVLGPWVVRLLLGGPVIGGDSLSRFFALHVFVIPGALLFFLAVHLWLVLKCGISAPPVPGQVVDPKTYDVEYEKQLKTGVPFLGDAMLKDAFFSALAVIVVVVVAAVLGPKGPSGPPDPTLAGANPRPEWPFLWLFALLSLSPPGAETFIILVFPVLLIVVLFLVPFVSNRGERAPSRRPVRRARRDRDLHRPRRPHVPGSHLALVAADDRLERRPDPRESGPQQHAVAVAGRRRVPEQELPQLPRPGRQRRPARPRPDDRRHAPDARPVDRPGQQRHPGRPRGATCRPTANRSARPR